MLTGRGTRNRPLGNCCPVCGVQSSLPVGGRTKRYDASLCVADALRLSFPLRHSANPPKPQRNLRWRTSTTARASRSPWCEDHFLARGRYELRFATMLDLIRIAYNVDPEKVSGGPNWLEMDRFDVFAKIPASSTAESRRQMLQAMLAERFKLAIHNDSRPMASLCADRGEAPAVEGIGRDRRNRMQFHGSKCPFRSSGAGHSYHRAGDSCTRAAIRAWRRLREECCPWQGRANTSTTSWWWTRPS